MFTGFSYSTYLIEKAAGIRSASLTSLLLFKLDMPFQNSDYWMPSMQGHYGLKYALPAIVPEMKEAYPDLDGIHNGADAMVKILNNLKVLSNF